LPNYKKFAEEAAQILAKVNTPEAAVALKGAEREQYLKALEHTFGPQAKRAKDMGFGNKTLYHGTPTPGFAKFDKDKNIFLTDNPNYADEYTVSTGGRADKFFNKNPDAPSILPLKMRTNKHVDLTTTSGEADYLKHLKDKGYGPGDEVYDDAAYAFETNNSWPLENTATTDEYLKSKKATSLETLENNNTNIRVENPNQVRSTNAAFDPRFKDSALIMAGVGGAAAAPSIVDQMNKPIYDLGNALQAAQDKVSKFSSEAGQKIADTVRPNVPMSKEALERERSVAGTAGEFGLDPTNFIAPGAKILGAAGMLAKAPEAAKILKLGNTLQDLNKDGKIVAKAMDTAGDKARKAAQANQEFRMAAKATEEAPVENVIKFKDAQTKEAAKQFAKESVAAELKAQPALARDPEYLKERIRSLFQFFVTQKR
jgi:hypothetical protein